MTDIMDRLDKSLQSGRPTDPEMDVWLVTLATLDPLRNVPERTTASAEAGLAAFLSEARSLPVSEPSPARHQGWKVFPFRKEHPTMNVLASLALVMSLVFGGAGATAFAAQNSQPDEALYGVKLTTEDLRLGLSADPQERLVLTLSLIQVRTQEMIGLVERGRPVPEALELRLESHIASALQAAAQLGDASLASALDQIQERSRAQLQAIAELREQAPSDQGLRNTETALIRMQAMAQLGQDDPTQFRQRARTGQSVPAPSTTPARSDDERVPATATPVSAEHGYGPGTGTCQDDLTPCTPEQDGNSYGPGPGNPSVTPGARPISTQPVGTPDGNGPGLVGGNGGANGNGQNGQPASTPIPTSSSGGGFGPGPVQTPVPNVTCTPEQDGNNYGPGPGNPSVTPAEGNGDGGSAVVTQSSGANHGPIGTPQPGNGRP